MPLDTGLFNVIHGTAGISGILDFAGVFMAEYLPYLLGAALLVFIFKRKGLKEKVSAFLYLVFAGIVSRYVLVSVLKFFVPRARPFVSLGFSPLVGRGGFSFPSGHAAFFFAVSLILLALNRKWGIWFLIFSSMSSIADVFVGVSWPSDILAGILVGFLTFWVFKFLFLKKNNEKPPLTEEARA